MAVKTERERLYRAMSTHKINPTIYLLSLRQMAEEGFEPRPFYCPNKYCNHSATEADWSTTEVNCDSNLFCGLGNAYIGLKTTHIFVFMQLN